ncbi:MAG: tetratricopeptide repeat protein [Methanomicrobiales archaeon]|nr:tetratricopeptide repeat protein [Methanomicrobiales archaeon]
MVTESLNIDRKIAKVDPSVECALRDAQNCKMAGDYQLALNLYDQIINNDPANSRALHHKANVLDLMGNYSEAIKCYDSALECDPYDAEVWYNKGMTLRKVGKHEEGLDDIKKGISLAMGDL